MLCLRKSLAPGIGEWSNITYPWGLGSFTSAALLKALGLQHKSLASGSSPGEGLFPGQGSRTSASACTLSILKPLGISGPSCPHFPAPEYVLEGQILNLGHR